MNKKQFFRLSLILVIPFFIMGYFLASSSQLNPKNIVTFCDFSSGSCQSHLERDDYNYYEHLNPDDTLYNNSIYFPTEPHNHMIFIKNSSWMLSKKQQVYQLKDYGSAQAIEQAFSDGDEGISTLIRTNNLFNIETSCYFSRHENTDLFSIKTTGHQNSACPGSFYFKPYIADLNKLNLFDRQTINNYAQLKTIIYIKSIIIFLVPFFIYVFLFFFIILIKKLRSFVETGSLK